MATQMGEGGQYGSDRERLAIFVLDTGRVLSLLVEYREMLIPLYMQEDFNRAWPRVDEEIHNTVEILKGKVPFGPIWLYPFDEGLSPDFLDRLLVLFGLTGQQLDLKLNIFNHYFIQVVEDPEYIQLMINPNPTNDQVIEKKKKSGLMGKILGLINSILGSLSGAIPGVDMIKEYKEMAEHGYNESQE